MTLPDPTPRPRAAAPVVDIGSRRTRPLGALCLVRKHSTAKGPTRAVLLVIASHADPDGSNAWPAMSTLAAETGLSLRTVRRAIRRLEDSGELVVERQGTGRTSTRYRVTVSPPAEGLSPPVDNPVQESLFPIGREDRESSQGGQPDPPGRTESPPTDLRPTIDREGVTPARCTRHAGIEDPPPCRGCATARETRERQDKARTAHEAGERRRREAQASAREREAAASPDVAAKALAEIRARISTRR